MNTEEFIIFIIIKACPVIALCSQTAYNLNIAMKGLNGVCTLAKNNV